MSDTKTLRTICEKANVYKRQGRYVFSHRKGKRNHLLGSTLDTLCHLSDFS